MPVIVSWHDPANTVLRLEISDPWALPDLSVGIQTSRSMLASVNSVVDVIWDGTKTKGIPSNIISHFMFPNADTAIPSNQGVVVVVVPGVFLHTFAALAKRMLPAITRQMHITTSLPAAENKIAVLRTPPVESNRSIN